MWSSWYSTQSAAARAVGAVLRDTDVGHGALLADGLVPEALDDVIRHKPLREIRPHLRARACVVRTHERLSAQRS